MFSRARADTKFLRNILEKLFQHQMLTFHRPPSSWWTLMPASASYPELFEDLIAKLSPALKKCGVAGEHIPRITIVVVDLIRREWGGSTVYVPIGVSFNADEMAQRVYAKWNGRNTRELSTELGVSGRRINQLYERGKRLAQARD